MRMSLDASLALALNSVVGYSPVTDALVYFCASTLAYLTIALFAGLVIQRFRSGTEYVELVGATLVSAIVARFGIAELIRFWYHRPRPFLSIPVRNLFTDPAWSFPSGHATFFFALATAIYLHDRRWGRAFFALATVISVGRVMAGVHYPLDILAGALIGSFTAYIVDYLMRRYL